MNTIRHSTDDFVVYVECFTSMAMPLYRWAFIFTVGLILGVPVFIIEYIPYRHTEHDGNRTYTSKEWPRIGGNGPNTQTFILFILATIVQVCFNIATELQDGTHISF